MPDVNQELTSIVNQWLTCDMDQLHRALRALHEAEQGLEKAVAAERAMGRSWANIGERLGVTRQAAFKRFGRVTDVLTGEIMTARSIDHLTELTEAFFTHVARGEQELTMGMVHPTVRRELPWESVSAAWNRCLAEFGALERPSGSFITHPGGLAPVETLAALSDGKMLGIAVGVTTLEQEAGAVMGRVAFDQDDAIVGVLYLSTDTPQSALPF